MKDNYDFKNMKKRDKQPIDPEADRVQISLKMDGNDLAALRTEAKRLGIPYQTLLNSVIHRFVNGEFVDRKEIEHQSRYKISVG